MEKLAQVGHRGAVPMVVGLSSVHFHNVAAQCAQSGDLSAKEGT